MATYDGLRRLGNVAHLRHKAHDPLVPQQLVCFAIDGDTASDSPVGSLPSQSRHQRSLACNIAHTMQLLSASMLECFGRLPQSASILHASDFLLCVCMPTQEGLQQYDIQLQDTVRNAGTLTDTKRQWPKTRDDGKNHETMAKHKRQGFESDEH